MKLKVKKLKWSAGRPVAIINTNTAEKLGVKINERILLKKDKKQKIAVVDTAEKFVKEREIAFSSELLKETAVDVGDSIDVSIAPHARSLHFIKKKLEGKRLSKSEINSIVKDIVDNSLSETEVALFISGTYKTGMTNKEIIYLINAFLDNGNRLKFKNRTVVDKHCIGGIPGNRTTPLVVSICAAAGLTMPKNSSRAITSAAGTVDVIETIAEVSFSLKELKSIVNKTNACMVWGGSLSLVPADSKIIHLEKTLSLDPRSQLLASILSKKLAAGSDYILIDIPYGKGAKVTKKQAESLRDKFQYFGRYFKKELKVVLTKGDEPIGNGVGPVLELKDILNVLNGKQGPKDLEEKSVFLAGTLLEMTGKAKPGKGEELAKNILYSGKALEKFKEIIKAQKGDVKKLSKLSAGKYKKDINAIRSGRIAEIENKKVNALARVAGCPTDKKAGIYIYKHKGEIVKKGETIYTIYAETSARLKDAIDFNKKVKPFQIK